MARGLVLHEQRRLARRELIYYLKLTDRRTGQELGRMGDIHANGMLIMSETPLSPGAAFDASLDLPKAMQTPETGSSLALRVEVLWCRPGPKNSTYHENGVRILDVDDTRQSLITQLIEAYAMPGG